MNTGPRAVSVQLTAAESDIPMALLRFGKQVCSCKHLFHLRPDF